jgi:hypothetical protein
LLSESQRMTTAREAAFRVQAPNSLPRASTIIALDAKSGAVMRRVAEGPWNGSRFFTLVAARPVSAGLQSLQVDVTLADETGAHLDFAAAVAATDVVIMVVSAGEAADAAAVIGNACLVRGIMTTGIILSEPGDGIDASVTLRDLRPYAAMLVVAQGEDYVPAMLSALRA